MANIGKLQQVIMNLLTNAKDATQYLVNGGMVKIETSDDGKTLLVRVSDNGTGISEFDFPRIFDPFYTTKEPGKGTGLGLSISSSILTEFGGTLTVESEVGIGTSFDIRLPLVVGLAAVEQRKTESAEVKLKGTALIVDDEPGIVDLLKSFLVDMGLEVSSAEDGQVALDILKNERFDFVITDVKMKRLSGDQVLVQARKLRHLENTHFVVITGGILTDYTKEQRDVIRELAHGFLRKPFDADDVAKVLQKLQKEGCYQ